MLSATVAVALALFFSLVCFSPGRLMTVDTEIRREIARSLWQDGDVFTALTPENQGGLVRRNSSKSATRGTSFYGIGQSLILIPFDLIGVGLAKTISSPAYKKEAVELLPLSFLYGPLMGLLFFYSVMVLLTTLGFSTKVARATAAILLLTTTALIYSVQILQDEIPIAVLLCFGLTLALRYLSTKKPSDAFWAALLVASSFLFRLNAIFALLPLAGLIWDRSLALKEGNGPLKKAIPAIVLGVAVPLLIFMAFSFWRYGEFFSTGYAKLPDAISTQQIQWNLAWGVLFGLGKGFFILSPVAFLAFAGFWNGRRRYPYFIGSLFLCMVASSLVYSRLTGAAFPDGSESWGDRFHTHLWFFFGVGLALFLERKRISTFPKLIILVSFLFQIMACWAPDAFEAFPHPNEAITTRKTRMLLSGKEGQLGRRMRTVGYFFSGYFPQEWVSLEPQKKMAESFLPNVWGISFWKRIGVTGLGLLCIGLWSLCLASASYFWYLAWRKQAW